MKTSITIAAGETLAVDAAGSGAIAITLTAGALTVRRELPCATAAVLALGLEMALGGQAGTYTVKLTTLERLSVSRAGGGIVMALTIPVAAIQRLLTVDVARALLYGLEKALEAADCAAARAAARAAA